MFLFIYSTKTLRLCDNYLASVILKGGIGNKKGIYSFAILSFMSMKVNYLALRHHLKLEGSNKRSENYKETLTNFSIKEMFGLVGRNNTISENCWKTLANFLMNEIFKVVSTYK